MRTHVLFLHPAEFVPLSEDDGVMATRGAGWFVVLLERVQGLTVRGELLQEDWGIRAFVEREGRRFWVGLAAGLDEDEQWLAHFHHDSWASFQPWTAAGNRDLERLLSDFQAVLAGEPVVRNIAWYHDGDVDKSSAQGAPTPYEAVIPPRTS